LYVRHTKFVGRLLLDQLFVDGRVLAPAALIRAVIAAA
jgi:hypothetical protein